jgi:predicted HAD superfamily Cof-like phosphohydrolase
MSREIRRIIYWNAARYKQEYSPKLTNSLLDEELEELRVAKTDVDILDALIDITYVAIGAMWKLGLNSEQIEAAINVVCDSNDSKTAKATASHIKANIDKGEGFIRPEPRLQEILDE